MTGERNYPLWLQPDWRGRSYFLPTRRSVVFRRILCIAFIVTGITTVVIGVLNVKCKIPLSSQLVHDSELIIHSMPVVQGLSLISLGIIGTITTKKTYPGPLLIYWILFIVNIGILFISFWIISVDFSRDYEHRKICRLSENCDKNEEGHVVPCQPNDNPASFCDGKVELRYIIDVFLFLIYCFSILLVSIGALCDPFQSLLCCKKRKIRSRQLNDVTSVEPQSPSSSGEEPPPSYNQVVSTGISSNDISGRPIVLRADVDCTVSTTSTLL
ncbi:uncharacterized protein [Apostichopus japonicus]|uniref:uncharacterized protein n=1 Tax=Stichopus japonicus TaxID=307972 RepID=UPI003AB44BA6